MMRDFTGDALAWDSLIAGMTGTHLLQTREWAKVKQEAGWEPMPFIWESDSGAQPPSAAAQVLKRRIPMGGFAARLCILYCPKGPVLDWSNDSVRNTVLDNLQDFARKQGAIFLKLDPDVVLGTGLPNIPDERPDKNRSKIVREMQLRGWHFSSDQIQYRNTVMIDLSMSEEQLLANMKQKTRYNLRLAEKKGVTVRIGSAADLPILIRMFAETSLRDGFAIRDENYYKLVWGSFLSSSGSAHRDKQESPWAEPLIAELDGQPIAAVIIYYFARKAYYLYGMSIDRHREKMPNHLLQWKAIQSARKYGCSHYDLWGAPDYFVESDGMWNVYRFKEGLGGQVVRTLGAWDYAPNPLWYRLYSRILPRVLDFMRFTGRAKTIRSMRERTL